MRAVLDTDVIVSGLLTAHGTCGQIVDLLLAGGFEICFDDRILTEYDEVLRRAELGLPLADVEEVLSLVRNVGIPTLGQAIVTRLPDPDDLPFLDVAAAGNAVLVTGNLRHFPRRARTGVSVVSPAEFVDLLKRSE